MEKITLSNNNNNYNYISNVAPANNCDCSDCGACLTCIVFAPIVGIFLASTLGLAISLNYQK